MMKHTLLTVLAVISCLAAASAANLELSAVQQSQAVAVIEQPFQITCDLRNTAPRLIEHLTVDLFLPLGWQADPVQLQIAALGAYTTHRIRFNLKPVALGEGYGLIRVSAPSLPTPLERRFHVVATAPLPSWAASGLPAVTATGQVPDNDTLYLSTSELALFLPSIAGKRGAGFLYGRAGGRLHRFASLPAAAHLVYADGPGEGVPTERWIYAPEVTLVQDRRRDEFLLGLEESWQDARGRTWSAKLTLAPARDPRVIRWTAALRCSGEARLYRFAAPLLGVGDGTFGSRRQELLLPGHDAAADARDGAVVLRTSRVERGLMAVAPPAGGVIALFWDPAQLWSAGKDSPQGTFAAPNTIDGFEHQMLSLLVPHFSPEQPSSALTAQPPYLLPANRSIYLRGEVLVSAAGGITDAVAAWTEEYGPVSPAAGNQPPARPDL